MTDLIERLRIIAGDINNHDNYIEGFEIDEAADEIERLRALTEWQPIETAPKEPLEWVWLYTPLLGRVRAMRQLHPSGDYWESHDTGRPVTHATHWKPVTPPPGKTNV